MEFGTANPVPLFRRMTWPAMLLAVIVGSAASRAQETASATQETSGDLSTLLKPGANLIYKDPDSNKLTPLPAFSKDMLEDVLERARLQAPIRLFDFVELKISGQEEANGFAYLQADLQVRVHVENERVRVPVGFNDFKLRDRVEHICDSTDAWASLETSKLPAKSWILFGKGLHRLTFDLIGQVRTTTNGQQRIRLDTPVVPLSSLVLRFHEAVDSAQLTNGNPVDLRKVAGTDVSEVQTWGLGKQTEIVWTPRPKDEDQTISVRFSSPAKLTLDMTTDPGSLNIRQPLSITGGSVDHLHVQLPSDFPEVTITGIGAEGDSIVRMSEQSEDGHWVVTFVDPITGPITLSYDLGLQKRPYPQDISIALPDIANATNETGDIELFVPIGLDVKVNKPEEKNTRQIRVESSKGERTTVVAYRLLSTESRLDLTVSERETLYFVTPHISFETERDQVLQRNNLFLTARFKVNIVEGLLNEIDLTWPGFTSDGWQIYGDTRLINDAGTTPITGFSPRDNPDKYSIVFPERQSGQFEIELQAFRDLESVQASNGVLFLPDIVSPAPHTTTVSLIESDADSMVLRREGEEASFPALPYSRWPAVLKNSEKPLSAWLVGSPNEPVQIQITAQKSEVRVSQLTALTLVNESIAVRQVISYDVRHEDLSEVRLLLPNVAPTVRLRETQEILSGSATTSDEAIFNLPAPRRGRFDITVEYYWSPESSQQVIPGRTFSLPIAVPSLLEKQFESSVVGTNSPESLLLASSLDWHRIHRDDFAAAWQCSSSVESVPIQLRHTLEHPNAVAPQFIVLNSAVIGRKLMTSVTGVFPEGISSALFTTGNDAKVINAYVGNKPAYIDRLSSNAGEETLFQVRTKGDTVETGLVQIKLVVEQPFDQQHHLFSACRPRLPGFAGDAARRCNSIWILSQTSDQSVFDLGDGMTYLSGGVLSQLFGEADVEKNAIAGLLSPYDVNVQTVVTELVDQATKASDRFEISAGAVYAEDHQIIVLSRQAVFLAAAIFSLCLYFAFTKLPRIHLLILSFSLIATVIFAISMTTTTVHMLLIQFIPGSTIALFAALMQRSFARKSLSLIPNSINSEGSTVFAVDQPLQISDATAISIGRS